MNHASMRNSAQHCRTDSFRLLSDRKERKIDPYERNTQNSKGIHYLDTARRPL